MPRADGRLAAWWPSAPIAVIAAGGFALSVFVFYPGVMTYDALYVYKAIADGKVGDWQSPVMTALWAVVDPVAPGPGSMFLLTAALYWLGFGLFGIALSRHARPLGIIAVLLAFTPPAFMFVGMIWRDVLFACVWLLAAALAFATTRARAVVRRPVQASALVLIVLGVTLRPNALFAAPILVAYVAWPAGFGCKRAALAYVPTVLVLYGLVQVIYYDFLGATRQHPLHSLYVFDLGGITHFSKANQFPVTWPPDEQQRLITDCYDRLWDVYWHGGRCKFVMGRIENEQQIFGTPALAAAWRRAIARHPTAYLRHRAAFMNAFLFGSNLTIWTQDINAPGKLTHAGNLGFVDLVAVHDTLKPTPLFRVWLWLLLCAMIIVAAWRRRETPAGAFALAVAGSGVVYVLTYAPVGVAADFRYAYWAVLAALNGGAALAAAVRPTRPPA